MELSNKVHQVHNSSSLAMLYLGCVTQKISSFLLHYPTPYTRPCRFAAVVELEMALNGNADKKLLMRALARRRDNQFDNFFDRLITELFITGTLSPLIAHHKH